MKHVQIIVLSLLCVQYAGAMDAGDIDDVSSHVSPKVTENKGWFAGLRSWWSKKPVESDHAVDTSSSKDNFLGDDLENSATMSDRSEQEEKEESSEDNRGIFERFFGRSKASPKDSKAQGLPLSEEDVAAYRKVYDVVARFDYIGLRSTVRPVIEKVFPIQDYGKLLKEIIDTKSIPVDAPEQIDAIVSKMQASDEVAQVVKAALAKHVIKDQTMFNSYAEKSFQNINVLLKASKFLTLKGVVDGAADIQTVLNLFKESKNPEEVIVKVHAAGLSSFKDVPFEKFLDLSHDVRVKGLKAADKTLVFADMYRTYLLMALGLAIANLVCLCIVLDEEYGTHKYRVAQDILTGIAVVDTMAFMATVGTKFALATKFNQVFGDAADKVESYDENIQEQRQSVVEKQKSLSILPDTQEVDLKDNKQPKKTQKPKKFKKPRKNKYFGK